MKFNMKNISLKSVMQMVSGLQQQPIQQPNRNLNVGIFEERTNSLPQINFIEAKAKENNKKPIINEQYETGTIDTARGARTIPDIKDYWLGSPN